MLAGPVMMENGSRWCASGFVGTVLLVVVLLLLCTACGVAVTATRIFRLNVPC